jgi:hypothetical protein
MSDWFLFRSSLRDLVRPKRILTALVLISLPALIALLIRLNVRPGNYKADEVYAHLSSGVVFGFTLVILAVVFATGALSQEIEQKTVVYLLTRPLPRWRILLSKFAAALIAIIVTVCLSSALLAFTTFSFGGADSRTPLLTNSDLPDPMGLAQKLKDHKEPVSEYIWTERISQTTQLLIDPPKIDDSMLQQARSAGLPVPPKPRPPSAGQIRRELVRELNDLIQSDDPLYDADRFAKAPISSNLRSQAAANPSGKERLRVNRLLLEAAFPGKIAHIQSVPKLVTRDLLILPVGAVAYAALFLFMATMLRRPLIWGLVFAFGWESWTPSLPDKFQMVSLMSYLRALAPHDKPDADTVDVTQLFTNNGGEIISNTLAWTVLASVIVVFLLLALTVFSNREYVPREDAE